LQLLRSYPLISYFVIAYAFTAAYDFLVMLPNPDLPSFPRDFGTSVAAVLVTAAIGGQTGVKALLRRLVLWRVPARWYLFVFIGIPAIFTIGIVMIPGALASFRPPSLLELLVAPGLVAFLYTVVLGGPLFEEPGWRGFALPRMQTRWGPLMGAVILGVLWAAWHFTEYLTDPDFTATNGGLTPQGVAVFVLTLVSFSVIITWVFNHTQGSLFIVILLHATINWSQLLTSTIFPAVGTNENGPLVAFGALAVLPMGAAPGRPRQDPRRLRRARQRRWFANDLSPAGDSAAAAREAPAPTTRQWCRSRRSERVFQFAASSSEILAVMAVSTRAVVARSSAGMSP
jgi:membrane protease YdiL (CAAX protease family)